jgi:hypothetical protein
MKAQLTSFKKPVHIIQVFRTINIYTKAEKSFADRKDKLAWKPISSIAGYVRDGIAYLPEDIVNYPNFETYDIILMMDKNLPNPRNYTFTTEENLLFRRNSQNKFDAFSLKFDENIEIHLNHSYFSVGTPKRENFKICDLKLNQPIEIKINGKIDFSGSGRLQRSFMEQDYIFEYLGEFTTYNLIKEPVSPIIKDIPTERKLIDLNKTLY